MTDIDTDISVVQRLKNIAALETSQIASLCATDPADTIRRLCIDALAEIEFLSNQLEAALHHD